MAFPELSGSNWDSVSTLDGAVSTIDAFLERFLGCFGTAGRHEFRSGRHEFRSQQTKQGKKNDLVWMISCSPATKNFSTRSQQVVKLVPRVCGEATVILDFKGTGWTGRVAANVVEINEYAAPVSFYDCIKASPTPWYILGFSWLVLQHRTVRNTVITTTTPQACPELLPSFLSSVFWFITKLAVFRQLPTFHFDPFISRRIPSSNWPLVVAVEVIIVATKRWNSIRCSLLDKDRLRVVLAPHALYFGHGVLH
ncbi:hypothetical protein Taro_011136 [Colocasia esculenta]|uniref:Uncharacterized protein n=1 Tax=Colocasia esculenta TaxID=4460 RepID=A0A843U5A1_COLES|nr:hypothetical protein [Colocasia esculenta]